MVKLSIGLEQFIFFNGGDYDEVYGIFSAKLAKYPYALKVQIDIIPQEGDSYTLLSFKHPGGNLTVPYKIPRFSVLVLSVQDKEISRTMIQ